MSQGEQPISCMLRLSEAVARLRAAGVGEVDMLATIANAALHGSLVATGYRSVIVGGQQQDSADRLPVRRMTWRVLASTRSGDAGISRMISGDDLIWNRGDHVDEFAQEGWRSVFVDSVSFENLLRDVVDHYRPAELSQDEIEEWIRDYPGSNHKIAWADFQLHFGARPFKRDERFMPSWREVRGHPQRGQPRKKSPTPSPA